MVDCYIEMNYMGMKRQNFRGLGDLISSQRDQKVRREEVNGEEEEWGSKLPRAARTMLRAWKAIVWQASLTSNFSEPRW